ncbi:arylalkylamine N-acetyltransferase 1-like [Onthophagus taurus]|uniref:arylalkylamine N-acetyltransferase 1-like n=1 Tax=Onthophagus taurus TaxID=166361 RepID=UPI000C2030C6|nr:dopamine N-acetyltransferase-like [Onthophagus taurus]
MSLDNSSTSSTPTTPLFQISPKDDYSIKPIKEEDYNNVIRFLRKFFFRDEPLNTYVKLLDDENGTCPELEEYSVQTIKDGISLMAVSASGQIIGVCLNGIIRRNENRENCNDDNDNDVHGNEKFLKIIRFLRYADKMSEIFEKFTDVDKVLCVKILSVDGSFRGRGIAKQLMDRTRQIAKEEDFGLMRGDCTSYYSARALARLGFECVYTLKYEDYTEFGEVTFSPSPPHDAFTIYVQQIN